MQADGTIRKQRRPYFYSILLLDVEESTVVCITIVGIIFMNSTKRALFSYMIGWEKMNL